jgi:hypothetical protein
MSNPSATLTAPHTPGSGFLIGSFAAAIAENLGAPATVTVVHNPSPTLPVPFSGTFSVGSATNETIQGLALIAGTDGPFSAGDAVTFSGLIPEQPGGGGTPGGSSGQIQFNSAGTAFGGTTNFGFDATNACPIWTPQSDPATPAAGDMWLSTTSLAPMFYRAAGLGGPVSQRIFKCGSCAPVVNVSGNTFAMASPTNPVGSLTIPANTLADGSLLRWVINAQYSCSGASPEIVALVLLNSAIVIQTSFPTTLAAAATNQQVHSTDGQIAILSTGSSATAAGAGELVFVQSAISQVGAVMVTGGESLVSSVEFDSTVPVFFDFQVGWNVADPSNSFQILSFSLFLE